MKWFTILRNLADVNVITGSEGGIIMNWTQVVNQSRAQFITSVTRVSDLILRCGAV